MKSKDAGFYTLSAGLHGGFMNKGQSTLPSTLDTTPGAVLSLKSASINLETSSADRACPGARSRLLSDPARIAGPNFAL